MQFYYFSAISEIIQCTLKSFGIFRVVFKSLAVLEVNFKPYKQTNRLTKKQYKQTSEKDRRTSCY